ncbi:MAG: hypothetical protein JSU92_12245 [Deltaproteobacteria bacterium]|nr:MAG: hypothetical protein JSU92_12245 [Deltaproteobacteria bacterium]
MITCRQVNLRKALLISLGLILILFLSNANAVERKYLLSLYHYNIQYVAGGVDGLLGEPGPDAEELEDRIITESFAPVVDLFYRHPDWGADFELQAYFIEVLSERFPEVLTKLKEMAGSGQIDVVSLHYSDQLFLAFPRRDLEASYQLTEEIFQSNELTHSVTVFAQEGQFGEGLARFLEEREITIGVLPKNLYKYLHGNITPLPYYTFGGIYAILGGEWVNYNDGTHQITVGWSFLDDGEKLATGGLDPYFHPWFYYDPVALAGYEFELSLRESEGYRITTISKYIEEIETLGITPAELLPLLDGTWQPGSHLTSKWLGGISALGGNDDNYVRTLQYTTRQHLLAAETLIDHAANRGVSADKFYQELDEGWRYQCLAEVTDCTGINPWQGEVDYGIEHANLALSKAEEIINSLGGRLGYENIRIDASSGEVIETEGPTEEVKTETVASLSLTIDAPGREVDEKWYSITGEEGRTDLELSFGPMTGNKSYVTVRFPWQFEKIVYSPALEDGKVVEHPMSNFVFDRFALALANGLIGLGENLFLIKHCTSVHVAATINRGSDTIEFKDDTAPPDRGFTWRFSLISGDAGKALALADRLNVHPVLDFQIPPQVPREEGCSCSTAAGARSPHSLLPYLLIVLLFLFAKMVRLKFFVSGKRI